MPRSNPEGQVLVAASVPAQVKLLGGCWTKSARAPAERPSRRGIDTRRLDAWRRPPQNRARE
ncbi:hypothetical protein FJV41_02055 [Myxococcus llanfairpwllgwyngyllgogerychwyrndrobwllllantysiliogogogochensis]|uniref:Uncharacterized protein n=1 Tax=Myxococcus llanfairpwllgwyngyllgogerychwyrndrobwllllantysiliogogogochensis TaxID=2590453 RepID=A0A540X905_9BACT|nr:hypothetical protein FJV41_02055 [Myxococcus llanfairpwllgwyngyllgogerychwyrndrobwllllantysiliogogogochensis]